MSAPGLFPEEPSVVTFPTVWISEPDGHPLLQLILGTRAALKFFTRNADGFLAALPSEAVGIHQGGPAAFPGVRPWPGEELELWNLGSATPQLCDPE